MKKLTKKQVELNAQAKTSKKITEFFAGRKAKLPEVEPMKVDEEVVHRVAMEWEDLLSVSWSQQERNRDKAKRLKRASLQRKAMLAKLEVNKVFKELLRSLVMKEMDKPTSVKLLTEQ